MADYSRDEVGFILATHANPGQVLRLVRRLNVLYDHPAIVIHHDFSKCDLPAADLTPNVSLVQPHFITEWAGFEVVDGIIAAMRLMLNRTDCPKWQMLLSGTDYPIKPAWCVARDLSQGGYDAHLEHVRLELNAPGNTWRQGMLADRYLHKRIHIPWMTKKFRFRWKEIYLPFGISAPLLPFSPSFICYAGYLWFSMNQRAAECIVRDATDRSASYRHFRSLRFSDEAYFQTTLLNAPGIRVHNEIYRYVDWTKGGYHPKTLGLEDVARLIASPDHFARKFDPAHPEVLDAIDAAVDAMPSPRA